MTELTEKVYQERSSVLRAEIETAEKAFAGAALAVAIGASDDSVQEAAQQKIARLRSQIEALDAAWGEARRVKAIEDSRIAHKSWVRDRARLDKLYEAADQAAEEVCEVIETFDAAIDKIVELRGAFLSHGNNWRGPLHDRDGTLNTAMITFRGRSDKLIDGIRKTRSELADLRYLTGEIHAEGMAATSTGEPVVVGGEIS